MERLIKGAPLCSPRGTAQRGSIIGRYSLCIIVPSQFLPSLTRQYAGRVQHNSRHDLHYSREASPVNALVSKPHNALCAVLSSTSLHRQTTSRLWEPLQHLLT